jgi:hypothetical protein
LDAAIPARFRPLGAGNFFPIAVKDDGVNLTTPGLLYMDSAGNVGVYKDFTTSATFTNGGTSGLPGFVNVAYQVA